MKEDMIKKVYYIERSGSLVSALEYLDELIPCYWDLEPVEMGFMAVEVICFKADLAIVEKVFAPII